MAAKWIETLTGSIIRRTVRRASHKVELSRRSWELF